MMRRIVVDTNCLLAVLPSQSPYHSLWLDFIEGRLELCVSNEILSSFRQNKTGICRGNHQDSYQQKKPCQGDTHLAVWPD